VADEYYGEEIIDSRLDFEDIPRITNEQLRSMVRLRDVKRKDAQI
jgi:hypothetical protein